MERLHTPEGAGGQHPNETGLESKSHLNRRQQLEIRLRDLLIPKEHEAALQRLLELRKKGTNQAYEGEEHSEYLRLQDQLLQSDTFASLRDIEIALVQLAINEEKKVERSDSEQ